METALFLFIQTLLQSVTDIKHFDWYNDQFNSEEDELPFPTPAVFLEIMPYQTQSLGKLRQAADIQFMLHVGQQLYSNTRRGAKAQSKALSHLNLNDLVFAALHGKYSDEPINNSTIGTINRTSVNPDHRFSGYIIHIISFKTRLISDNAVIPTVPVSEGLKTTVSEVVLE
jgi:hypothetical protein